MEKKEKRTLAFRVQMLASCALNTASHASHSSFRMVQYPAEDASSDIVVLDKYLTRLKKAIEDYHDFVEGNESQK